MKQFGKFLNDTGNQILSTVLLVFSVYCLVKGIAGIATDPPPLWVIDAVGGFGFILGALKFFTDEKLTGETDKKDSMED